MTSGSTRRRFLQLAGPAVLGLSGVACSKREDLKCNDVSGLAPEDVTARKSLEYKERADKPELACENCSQYVPPSGSGCGTCQIMRGPIHPDGWCKVFTPKS